MNRLPNTDSITALAELWQTHDLTDFEDALVEVAVPAFERAEQLSVSLPPKDAAALRARAQQEEVPYPPRARPPAMLPVDAAKIREIADLVVAALAPDRVVLFGSYAWGQPDADSDVDLYVIVAEQGEPVYRLARRAYHALRGMRVPVDLVVRTRGESERNAGLVSTLDHLALTRGVPLYG